MGYHVKRNKQDIKLYRQCDHNFVKIKTELTIKGLKGNEKDEKELTYATYC